MALSQVRTPHHSQWHTHNSTGSVLLRHTHTPAGSFLSDSVSSLEGGTPSKFRQHSTERRFPGESCQHSMRLPIRFSKGLSRDFCQHPRRFPPCQQKSAAPRTSSASSGTHPLQNLNLSPEGGRQASSKFFHHCYFASVLQLVAAPFIC